MLTEHIAEVYRGAPHSTELRATTAALQCLLVPFYLLKCNKLKLLKVNSWI